MKNLLCVILLIATVSPLVSGQWSRRRQTEYFTSKVQVAGSRLAEQNVEKAKKDIEAGEFDSAVRLIQATIDKFGSRAFKTEANRHVGIREYCNQMILTLPEKGAAAYRRIFEPYARSLYDRAIEDHDTATLRTVFYRYQNTSFGKKALLAAISIEFERGRLEPTRELCLLYLSVYGEDEDARGPLTALILASGFADDADKLKELATRLKPETLSQSIELGARSTTVAAMISYELSRIKEGNADLSTDLPKAIFFKDSQWVHELPMLNRKRSSSARADDFGSTASPVEFPWNPVVPVIDEGSVFLTNGVFVRALELYSRTEKWQYRGWVDASQARQNRALVLPIKLHDNIVYASLETPRPRERTIWTFVPQEQIPHRQLVALDASTGKVIWQHYRWRGKTYEETEFVANLNINSEPLIIGDRLFVAASRFHTSYHQYLCCFDKNDGTLLWSTFVCTGQMEQNMFGNRVREAVSGQLAAKDGIIYHSTNIGVLAAIDARLGTLLHTATYEQIRIPRQTRFDTRIHERAPAWSNCKPIIVGEEVYFAPMDCQEVLVMNRNTGLIKGTGIERNAQNRFRFLLGPSGPWIIAAGAEVCFYNTETRQSLVPAYMFSRARRSQSNRSAGIVARPLLRGNRLLAPVNSRNSQKYLVWSVNDQRIVDEVTFPASRNAVHLGNMSEKDGVYVVASTTPSGKYTQVRTYFSRALVRQRLEADIKARPDDPKAHFRMGEFSLQGKEKDYKAALTSFENARILAAQAGVAGRTWTEKSRNALSRLYLELASRPREAELKTGLNDLECFRRACDIATSAVQKADILFRVMRRSIDRRDPKTFSEVMDRLRGEFRDVAFDYDMQFKNELPEAQRRRYRSAGFMATAIAAAFAETSGKPADAIRYLQELISGWPSETIGNKTSWAYGHGRIEALIDHYGRTIYAPFDVQANRLLEESRRQKTLQPLQALIERFPNASVIPDAYNEISVRQFEAGNHAEAAGGLHEYFARFGNVTAKPLATLARSLEASGWPESARQVWARLADLGAHESDDVALKEMASKRASELATELKTATPPPTETFALSAQLDWKAGNVNGSTSWRLVRPKGRRTGILSRMVLAQQDARLTAFSLDDGSRMWDMDVQGRLYGHHARVYDGRLFLQLDSAVVCLDPATGREIWRHDAGDLRLSGFHLGQGKAWIILEATGFAVTFRIRALNVVDGNVIGERIMDGVAQGDGLRCGEGWLLVPLESRNAAFLVNGFSLENSPAWPDGADFDDDCPPLLSPDDHLVSIDPGNRGKTRELSARDPASGRVKWRRRLGEARTRFFVSNRWHTLFKVDGPRRSSPGTLLVIDNLNGNAVVKNTLPKYTTVSTPEVAGQSVLAIKSRLSGKRHAYNLEEVDMQTSSMLWRSMDFTGNKLIAAFPYDKGVVLRVVEHLRGNRRTRRSTTLYLLDRSSGRIESEIKLDSRKSTHLPEIQVINGRLVVSDGPVLKVYKP